MSGKMVLVLKNKLNNIEFLISKGFIDSCIIHYKFVLLNKVSKEYFDMKEAIKKCKTINILLKVLIYL